MHCARYYPGEVTLQISYARIGEEDRQRLLESGISIGNFPMAFLRLRAADINSDSVMRWMCGMA